MSICLHGERPPAAANVVDFELRHGTQDKQVFEDVVTNNQYRLPDRLPSDSLIIDIGANVGAFAVACLLRGAGTVVCFEPCPANFVQLAKNCQAWPEQVVAFQAAVWRSDRADKIWFINPGDHNTACGAVTPYGVPVGATGIEVVCIGLDELLKLVTENGKRRVNILKIDAEGSEYPILYTSKLLHLVDSVIGETHEYPVDVPEDEQLFVGGFPHNVAGAVGMKAFLEGQGFEVQQQDENGPHGICTLFFATRTPTPEQ